MKVRDIGEQGLLERLQRFCPPEIIGDDAAVLVTKPGESLVVTTDVLVDGVHFSEVTTSAEDAGWRAAAANLSDLAAMGATPLGITVGLGLPGEVSVSWVEELYQGITQCLQKYNTSIVGGDVVRSPVITLSITAFGQAHPHQIIRRNQAQVGDAIVVTGVHGASRAGLELLLHPELGQNLTQGDYTALILAHQRPQPRLDVLPILWEILSDSIPQGRKNPAPTPPIPPSPHPPLSPSPPLPISGMDSSDGLADAVLQICRASGVGAVLESTQIPLPDAFNYWLTKEKALFNALYGGEDFELVLCLPKQPAYALVQKLGKRAAIVGTITSGSKVILHDQNAKNPDQVLTLGRGFQHFGF
ncbi:thiamine-phosphate kinase [Hassallia byssoidea VB512170]|uniref:Thiamine-monophosphate kinase n=1 Tax=Hassallia byssoidea VB512170 TaxID=1304833 RepID=A0A846H6N5_9CYAN|nr:thiamine-phosphate kinase [Hassalia byssoidea]NEU72703.1 thiamine-phosphate kinase [Hassalia byssoidea VB512170]